jgi:uncharacterized membrane protein required for colicin V production
MNLVNILFIIVIAVIVLEGIYRGFFHSSLNLGAFFLSVVTSYLLYPVVSTAVYKSESLFKFFYYYTEGSELITKFEDSKLFIEGMSSSTLNRIISESSVSEPFASLIRQNVYAQAFAPDGLMTIGEYYNMTIVCAVLNILSFFAIFIIARIVYQFILGAVEYTVEFPELKRYDRTMGALFGLTRGVLFCFLAVTAVPVVLLIVPVERISEYFNASSIGTYFLNNDFFMHLIRGTI